MGTLPKSGSVTATTTASPEQVWAVLTDLARGGEWSHENQGGEWVDGATGPAVGARFRGHNKQGRSKWSRTSEVTAAEPGRTFAWRTVPSAIYRDSTQWTVDLEPIELDGGGNGTRITQSYEVVRISRFCDWLFYALIPAHRDRIPALQGDVEHLGEVAAGQAASASAPTASAS